MSNFETYLNVINSKPARALLRNLTDKECERTGKNVLKETLKSYETGEKDLCFTCSVKSKLFDFVLDAGYKFNNISMETEKETLQDPYLRRGLYSVLKGIADHGIKKPFVPSGPFLTVWNFTNSCNLNCQHCYQDAGKRGDQLDLDERLYVVDELDRINNVSIAFSGGEPLTDKDFFEVAEYTSKKGMHTALASNGTLIDKDTAQRLKDIGIVYVEISLDGTKETHNKFRGVKSYDRAKKGIENSREAGLDTCMAMTMTKQNYNEIGDMIELAKDMDVKFNLFNLVPTGRASIEMDVSPREREDAMEKLYKELDNACILTTAPQFGRKVFEKEGEYVSAAHFGVMKGKNISKSELIEFIGGCGAGRLYWAFQPNGDVKPCVFMPDDAVVGNVIKNDLKDLWENSKLLNNLRDREDLEGECGVCDNKYRCGGCRARAYAYFEDFKAPDPGCINNEEEYENFLNSLTEDSKIDSEKK